MTVEPTRRASLVASIHAPWQATVAECLSRWASLDHDTQTHSFLVVEGDGPGARHTLGASAIGNLVATADEARRLGRA